jgi:hypothetical protein
MIINQVVKYFQKPALAAPAIMGGDIRQKRFGNIQIYSRLRGINGKKGGKPGRGMGANGLSPTKAPKTDDIPTCLIKNSIHGQKIEPRQ